MTHVGVDSDRLEFSSVGVGVLISRTGRHMLVSSLLTKRLYAGRRESTGQDELFISGAESAVWVSDALETLVVNAISGTDAAVAKFTF